MWTSLNRTPWLPSVSSPFELFKIFPDDRNLSSAIYLIVVWIQACNRVATFCQLLQSSVKNNFLCSSYHCNNSFTISTRACCCAVDTFHSCSLSWMMCHMETADKSSIFASLAITPISSTGICWSLSSCLALIVSFVKVQAVHSLSVLVLFSINSALHELCPIWKCYYDLKYSFRKHLLTRDVFWLGFYCVKFEFLWANTDQFLSHSPTQCSRLHITGGKQQRVDWTMMNHILLYLGHYKNMPIYFFFFSVYLQQVTMLCTLLLKWSS